MITKTLKVPNDLSEITLGQYQRFNKVLSKDPDEDFLQKKTIEIFCGVELKDVEKYKYSSIVEVIKIINKMFEQKPNLTQRVNNNGIEFGFIPQLDSMTFGEFVDLDLLLSDFDTMDEAMAVLYRKIEHKHKNNYTLVEYNSEKITDMKWLPLDIVFGALFFLQSLEKELQNHTLSYLETHMKTIPQEQRRALMKPLAGGQVFTPYHKVG